MHMVNLNVAGVLGAVSTDIAEDLLVPRALPERREQRHCAGMLRFPF